MSYNGNTNERVRDAVSIQCSGNQWNCVVTVIQLSPYTVSEHPNFEAQHLMTLYLVGTKSEFRNISVFGTGNLICYRRNIIDIEHKFIKSF